MREIVGFVMGAAAGVAGALFVTSKEGREVIDRVVAESRPEVDRAARDWEPVLQEVGRAVRLAVREVEVAVADARARLAEIAAVPEPGVVAAPVVEPNGDEPEPAPTADAAVGPAAAAGPAEAAVGPAAAEPGETGRPDPDAPGSRDGEPSRDD